MNTRNVRIIGRAFGGCALLIPALYCGFGFLASFEPFSWAFPWQAGYAAVGCACVAGAALVSFRPSSQILAATGLGAAATFSVCGFIESSLWSLVAGQATYGTLLAVCMSSCGYFIGFELSKRDSYGSVAPGFSLNC
jgi:peptidoglycan/LPS O-acetylase OafA/YrhL